MMVDVSNLPCVGLKRANRDVVTSLNDMQSVGGLPLFHSDTHEPILTPIISVHYLALCGGNSRKTSIYADVQRINSPRSPRIPSISRVGGVEGVSLWKSSTDCATRNF